MKAEKKNNKSQLENLTLFYELLPSDHLMADSDENNSSTVSRIRRTKD